MINVVFFLLYHKNKTQLIGNELVNFFIFNVNIDSPNDNQVDLLAISLSIVNGCSSSRGRFTAVLWNSERTTTNNKRHKMITWSFNDLNAQQHIAFFFFHLKTGIKKMDCESHKKKKKREKQTNTKKRICIVDYYIHITQTSRRKNGVLQLLNKEWKEEPLGHTTSTVLLCHLNAIKKFPDFLTLEIVSGASIAPRFVKSH